MAPPGYILEVQSGGLLADVVLNGWPAFRATTAEAQCVQVALNAFLVEGTNHLHAAVAPLPDKDLPADAHLRLKLFKADSWEPGRFVEHLGYRWTPDESPLRGEGQTQVFSHRMMMRKAFGRWAWQDATPYSPEDRPAILALLGRLHAALHGRDKQAVLGMVSLKLHEMARAVGASEAQWVDAQRTTLEAGFAAPDWGMMPLDPASIVLVPIVGGRLVEVVRADGRPPLFGTGEQGGLPLELTVSKIGGTWQVVR
jgi:hypothetical protein